MQNTLNQILEELNGFRWEFNRFKGELPHLVAAQMNAHHPFNDQVEVIPPTRATDRETHSESEMGKHTYKLTYFDARGKAEAARLIFHYFNVPFEDVRIEKPDWPNHKQNHLFEQLPELSIDNGRLVLAQSVAIERYLAKSLNADAFFAGLTKPEAALCDMYVDACNDLCMYFIMVHYAPNDEAKAMFQERLDTAGSKAMEILQNHLNKNGGEYFVGKRLFWVDLHMLASFAMIEDMGGASMISTFGNIAEYYLKMRKLPELKEYIDKSWPETQVVA